MTQQTFTPQDIAECAQLALQTWTWNDSAQAKAQQQSLRDLVAHPERICDEEEGQMTLTLDPAFVDIWDFLSEYVIEDAHLILAAREEKK